MSNFPFIGPSYQARSRVFDNQRSVNLYPEMSQTQSSKEVSALIGTPGLMTFCTPTQGAGRGLFRFSQSIAMAVCGSTVYKITTAGVATAIGTIDTGYNVLTNTYSPVVMESNGTTVMLVTGSNGYFIDPVNGTVTQIVNANFFGADRVAFLDGYFIWNHPATGQFQTSGLYNTTISGTAFATAEGSPDLLLSLICNHRELWLFGENTTEVWYNSGAATFPIERIQGAFIEVGIAAKNSIAKLDNTIFWLAADERGDGIVMRANGYVPQRVSTHAVEYAIGQYSTISDAIAYSYQQEGHTFYVLSFPTANATWVFDAATNQWHERAWRDPGTGSLSRHRAQSLIQFNGSNICQDWETGAIYTLSLDALTDAGNPISRIRRCPHIADPTYKRVIHRSMQIDMETGVGTSSGQGVSPQAMLRVSDDGGATFPREYRTSIGSQGDRLARARFRRLGLARDRVYEFVITDPVKCVLVGAAVELEGTK